MRKGLHETHDAAASEPTPRAPGDVNLPNCASYTGSWSPTMQNKAILSSCPTDDNCDIYFCNSLRCIAHVHGDGMQSDNDEKTLLLTSSRLFDAYRGGDDDRRGEADEDIYDFCAAWVGRLVEISMGGEAETSAGVGDHSYAARLAREVASARGAPKELTRLPFEFGSKKKKFAKGRNTHAGVKRSRPERVEVSR